MYRIARLAFQTDSTRAITLMQNGVSTPAMQIQGATISDGYHNLSHHGKAGRQTGPTEGDRRVADADDGRIADGA